MKIIAVGRNYREHAEELDNPVPKEPVIFLKPDTALLNDNRDFYYPDFSQNIHHEVEVVLRICKGGKHIGAKFASTYYDAIGLGIDFTARDIQQKHKERSLPWELAKAFDGSAAVGNFFQLDTLADRYNLTFRLDKNGQTVQEGNTGDLLFSFEDLLVFVSEYITLRKGDLIFTGTPAGVGPVAIGDYLEGFLAGQPMFHFYIR